MAQFILSGIRARCGLCNTGMLTLASVMLAAIVTIGWAMPAGATSDSELVRGFNLTVFGAEYSPMGIQSRYVRKFRGTVKFKVHNLSRKNRNSQTRSFIRGLSKQIRGLKTQIVGGTGSANFNVYVVDRADYADTVRNKVYRRAGARVPGKCLVRSVFSRNGIVRSDAVIVSDEGEALFKRCLAEEILQGLGPLNEHTSLRQSMFNDRTKHTKFTKFDRYILNMLYDKRIQNGASPKSVNAVLPAVLRDVRRRLN